MDFFFGCNVNIVVLLFLSVQDKHRFLRRLTTYVLLIPSSLDNYLCFSRRLTHFCNSIVVEASCRLMVFVFESSLDP